MIDLIEVEKERLLDEVSFLWVLFYLMSIDRPAAPLHNVPRTLAFW